MGGGGSTKGGITEKIEFLGFDLWPKQPIPAEISMLVDIKTTQDHFLTHSLARTLDRQSFGPFTAARQLHTQRLDTYKMIIRRTRDIKRLCSSHTQLTDGNSKDRSRMTK